MGRELMPEELRELLAAYALDAVTDPEELAALEAFLARDEQARQELADLRETASFLAYVDEEAPASLWERIESSLGARPPRLTLRLPTPDSVVSSPGRRRGVAQWWRAAAAVAAAAALGVIVYQQVEVSDQAGRIDHLAASVADRGLAQAARAAAMDSRSHALMLVSRDQTMRAKTVMMPDGTGYLMENDLPPLTRTHTYQMWAITGDPLRPTYVSLGILGRDPDVSAFRADGPVLGFAVTVEEMPGVTAPHLVPVVEGRFA